MGDDPVKSPHEEGSPKDLPDVTLTLGPRTSRVGCVIMRESTEKRTGLSNGSDRINTKVPDKVFI